MKYFVCLQAGHQGVTSGATGAPGEQAFNQRIRDKVCEILLSKKNADGSDAFMLQLVNANPTDAEIANDYHLFLSIHYDANVYGTGGGFIDYPEPSTDSATQESQRIVKAMREEYFKHSGIVEHNERSNANTRYYYMWSRLSLKTPCAIIECGVGLDPHDNVILNDPNIVPNAIARGICKAFNVPFDPITTSTSTVTTTTLTTSTTLPPYEPCIVYKEALRSIHDLVGTNWITYLRSRNKIREILKFVEI